MIRNRIGRHYQDTEAADTSREPTVPQGFAAIPLAQLPPAAQQAIQSQRLLYETAFAQAIAENELRSFGSDDYSI